MIGTPPTIDNIIHSQGSFSHILYKSYIVTHAITYLLHSSYVWVGQFRLCSNLINGGEGVAIRVSWYAFLKKNSRGGVYSGSEGRFQRKVYVYIFSLNLFEGKVSQIFLV